MGRRDDGSTPTPRHESTGKAAHGREEQQRPERGLGEHPGPGAGVAAGAEEAGLHTGVEVLLGVVVALVVLELVVVAQRVRRTGGSATAAKSRDLAACAGRRRECRR